MGVGVARETYKKESVVLVRNEWWSDRERVHTTNIPRSRRKMLATVQSASNFGRAYNNGGEDFDFDDFLSEMNAKHPA